MFYSTAEEKATPIGLTRGRSNTFNSAISQQQQHIHNNEPQDLALSPGSDTQSSSGDSQTIRSPKLFINCVEIRQRARSHSTSSFSTRPGLSILSRDNPPRVIPPKTCGSPESMMSSTFPPPKRDLYGDEHARSLPSDTSSAQYHRKFQQLGASRMGGVTTDSDSEDYNMDSNDDDEDGDSDDMMDTESIDDEHQMPFKMEQRAKKRVTWRDEDLVQFHTYKSDPRYYERNPFYGFGKIEYGPDEETLNSPTTKGRI